MKNKKGNVAVIAIIIVIVAITAGVVGWIFAKKSQAPTQNVISSTEQKVITESNQNQLQGVVYDDSVYGFSLNFPQSWKGFKMTNSQEGATGFRITFTHPTDNCSFPVLLSTTKEWDDCKSQKDPNAFYWCGKELGRNEKYVFHPADNAPDCENANLVKETSDIIKTFKITDSISQTVTDLKTVKGWLEGTRSPLELVLAETTATLSGYSGNKFALVFSKDSVCTFVGVEPSFSCTDSKVKWGVGDRVRVYGSIKGGQILVDKLEIVSGIPVEKW